MIFDIIWLYKESIDVIDHKLITSCNKVFKILSAFYKTFKYIINYKSNIFQIITIICYNIFKIFNQNMTN